MSVTMMRSSIADLYSCIELGKMSARATPNVNCKNQWIKSPGRRDWSNQICLLPRSSAIRYATAVNAHSLHVSSRELIQKLRNDILRIQGFEVESTLSLSQALEMVQKKKYDLVLIDVEGENRVAGAELLCDEMGKDNTGSTRRLRLQLSHLFEIATARTNYWDDSNPELLVRSVREIIADL